MFKRLREWLRKLRSKQATVNDAPTTKASEEYSPPRPGFVAASQMTAVEAQIDANDLQDVLEMRPAKRMGFIGPIEVTNVRNGQKFLRFGKPGDTSDYGCIQNNEQINSEGIV